MKQNLLPNSFKKEAIFSIIIFCKSFSVLLIFISCVVIWFSALVLKESNRFTFSLKELSVDIKFDKSVIFCENVSNLLSYDVNVDDRVDDDSSCFKDNFDIVVANGQNALKDKIFRIGTLGYVCERDVLTAIASLEGVLCKLGYEFEKGAGVKAVLESLY